MKKELIFASFGLCPEQITFETISALSKCGKIYITCGRREKVGLLLSLFPKAELISAIPFEVLILKVMGAFLKQDRVGVLDYGDPSFLCFFSKRLRLECLKNSIAFRKYRAVSSLNTIISDFCLGDLDPAGLYLATAHSWNVPSKFINPAVPLLLFSLDRVRLDGDPSGLLVRIVKDIQRVYPPQHDVYFISCRNAAADKKRVRRVKVARLGKSLSALKFDTTIYIPAIVSPRQA